MTKIDKTNITGLTKEKKEILKSVVGTCNYPISFSDILHKIREESR